MHRRAATANEALYRVPRPGVVATLPLLLLFLLLSLGSAAALIVPPPNNISGFGLLPLYSFYGVCHPSYNFCDVFGGTTDAYGLSNAIFESGTANDSRFYVFERLSIANPPSPRSGGTLIPMLDAPNHAIGMIAFGGMTSPSTFATDTALYDWTTWRTLTWSTLPIIAVTDHSASFLNNTFFALFFGMTPLGLNKAVTVCELTFATMALSCHALAVSGGAGPAPRVGSCCAHDPANNAAVCVGGSDFNHDFGDVWLFHFSNNTFEALASPGSQGFLPRYKPQCAYYPTSGSVFVYGGLDSQTMLPVDDSLLWEINVAQRSMRTVLNMSAFGVPNRGGGVLSFSQNWDTNAYVLELFGGITNTGALGDHWRSTDTPQITSFQRLERSVSVPDVRQHHCTVAMGDGFLIAFGTDTRQVFNDVYYYFDSTQTWQRVMMRDVLIPSPRCGASATAVGSNVFFYGGSSEVDGSVGILGDMWSLSVEFIGNSGGGGSVTVFGTWSLVPPASAASSIIPPPLVFHNSFHAHERIYILCGSNSNTMNSNMYAFDLATRLWFIVQMQKTSSSATPPALFTGRFGASLVSNTTHVIVVGGLTLRGAVFVALKEVWVFTMPVLKAGGPGSGRGGGGGGGGGLSSIATQLSISAEAPTSLGRGFAAAAMSGNGVIIVCGGAVHYSTSVVVTVDMANQCLLITLAGGNTVLANADSLYYTGWWGDTWEAATVGGGAAFIGGTYYMFGGMLMKNQQQIFSFSDSMASYDFDAAGLTCPPSPSKGLLQGSTDDCIACAPGSLAQGGNGSTFRCSLTRTGFYWYSDGGGRGGAPAEERPCPVGTSSNVLGASSDQFCVACGFGTYAPTQGNPVCLPCPVGFVCPVGCITPLDQADDGGSSSSLSSSLNSSGLRNSQPLLYESPDLPTTLFVCIGVAIVLLLSFIAIVARQGSLARKARRDFYFSLDSYSRLRAMYDLRKTSHFGLDINALKECLEDLGIRGCSRKYIVHLLAEHDEHGSHHLTFTNFLDLLIQLMEDNLIPKNQFCVWSVNDSAAGLSTFKQRLASFKVKSLDAYDVDHSLGTEGDPVSITTTNAGGYVRLAYYVLSIAVIAALVSQFFFTNIVETRATVPSLTFTESEVAAELLTVNASILRGANPADCVAQTNSNNSTNSNTMNACSSSVLASIAPWSGNMTMRCYYDLSSQACLVSVALSLVSFPFASVQTMSIWFGGAMFATEIDVSIVSTSGIDTECSKAAFSVAAAGDQVLLGYPASEFQLIALPTSFVTVDNLVKQNQVSYGGYHIQPTSETRGNQIPPSTMSQFVGVPIEIIFAVQNTVLRVERLPQTSIVDLISQLLGALSGVGGLMIAILQTYDQKLIERRTERHFAEVEEALRRDAADATQEEEGDPSALPSSDKEMSLLVRK